MIYQLFPVLKPKYYDQVKNKNKTNIAKNNRST